MRLVVDTNVFISACLGSRPATSVLEACFTGRAEPVMGTALLLEYEAVLGREDLFRTSALRGSEREELLDIFLAQCRWVRIFYGWRPNLPDEGDNHLVELAVAAGNAAIVTRNLRDLQRMDLRFPGLRILSPETFLSSLP
jgi:predicted nucleic acid-binding protein